jgi:hypothetical protein
VRDARRRLRELAKKHPELRGPSSPRNRAGWEAALQENEMVESKVISFRFPDELRGRIERYAARLSDLAGVEVPRSRVVLKLLGIALDKVESEEKPKGKR